MTGLAQLERQQLSSTLVRVGPLAPTLCEGWVTKDLAAHIVLRERRPDAALGVLLGALAEYTQKVQDTYAEKAWPTLVEMVREGPPGWSPTRLPQMDDAINLIEFFVHHEDVLRAAPDWSPSAIRHLDDEFQRALWERLRQLGQLLCRKSPTGVVLVTPSHGRASVHRPTKLGTVVLRGAPSELVLYGYGRTSVAQVEIEGEPDAVEAFEAASFGM
ncbi:MAG: TIGR03085 family metal-binding protein [Dermatophilus congolensis]|nr:TIGR03085 family metal-binding protein [Dermatophilus congolensis]